jgi:hypothetical protein
MSYDKEKYPEIVALDDLFLKHRVFIKVSPNDYLGSNKDMPSVELTLAGEKFNLYIADDEEDFRYNYPLLNLCVILRDLEDYKFSNDYLLWCQERRIDELDLKAKDYYQQLSGMYKRIEAILGEVKSFVNDSDFDFSMGAVRALRKED